PGYPPSRLEVSGSVDVSLSGDLAELVREIDVRGGPVDVDASTVTFMDSAVLALLAHLAYRHRCACSTRRRRCASCWRPPGWWSSSRWCTLQQPAPETGAPAGAGGYSSGIRTRCRVSPTMALWLPPQNRYLAPRLIMEAIRLRLPSSWERCTAIQINQAGRPVTDGRCGICATAAVRPIVAIVPRSR